MGSCRLASVNKDGRVVYSCDYLIDHIEDVLREFREENASDQFIRDRYYEDYRDELRNFLRKCNCIPMQCPTCLPEDHEGFACRCEDRNIRLAKKLRAQGDRVRWTTG